MSALAEQLAALLKEEPDFWCNLLTRTRPIRILGFPVVADEVLSPDVVRLESDRETVELDIKTLKITKRYVRRTAAPEGV
jgi:hypothetical protein